MPELATGTAEQAAEKYAALRAEGNRLLDEADALMIRAALGAAAAGIRQRVTEHEARISAAEPELAAAQAELSRLSAELAECQRRSSAIQEAAADADLAVRIEARALRLAVAEEAADLTDKTSQAEHAVSGHDAAIGRAASQIQACEAELAELAAASADPFRHPVAQATKAYGLRVLSGRTAPVLLAGDISHPEYDYAHAFMIRLVKCTGFGAMHERQIEDGVRDQYSAVHGLATGIPWTGPPVATPGAVNATARPAVRLTSETEAANASPFERQHGIPGVRPSDAAMT